MQSARGSFRNLYDFIAENSTHFDNQTADLYLDIATKATGLEITLLSFTNYTNFGGISRNVANIQEQLVSMIDLATKTGPLRTTVDEYPYDQKFDAAFDVFVANTEFEMAEYLQNAVTILTSTLLQQHDKADSSIDVKACAMERCDKVLSSIIEWSRQKKVIRDQAKISYRVAVHMDYCNGCPKDCSCISQAASSTTWEYSCPCVQPRSLPTFSSVTPPGFSTPSGLATAFSLPIPSGFPTPSGFSTPSGFPKPSGFSSPSGFSAHSGFHFKHC